MYVAPTGVTAEPASPDWLKATVEPATDPTGAHHYVVQIQGDEGKACTTAPNEVICTIGSLSPVTQYTVQVMACLDENRESQPCSAVTVGGHSWTKPTRKGLKK